MNMRSHPIPGIHVHGANAAHDEYDKTWLDPVGYPHSEDLHVVESFRRADPNTLKINLTLEDPKAYTKPGHPNWRSIEKGWNITEMICEDNATFNDFPKTEEKPAK